MMKNKPLFMAISFFFTGLSGIGQGLVDNFFLGKIGVEAIPPVSLAMTIWIFFASFFAGYFQTITRNISEKNNLIKSKILSLVFIAQVLFLCSLISSIFIVPFFYKDLNTLYLKQYIIYLLPGAIFFPINHALRCYFIGLNKYRHYIYISLFSLALNTFLNHYFLTLGMGVKGLAIATSIAIFSNLIIDIILRYKKRKSDILTLFSTNKLLKKDFLDAISFGLFSLLEVGPSLMMSSTVIYLFGTLHSSAHHILLQSATIFFLSSRSIATAYSISYVAHKEEKTKIFKAEFVTQLAAFLFFLIITSVFKENIFSLFLTSSDHLFHATFLLFKKNLFGLYLLAGADLLGLMIEYKHRYLNNTKIIFTSVLLFKYCFAFLAITLIRIDFLYEIYVLFSISYLICAALQLLNLHGIHFYKKVKYAKP